PEPQKIGLNSRAARFLPRSFSISTVSPRHEFTAYSLQPKMQLRSWRMHATRWFSKRTAFAEARASWWRIPTARLLTLWIGFSEKENSGRAAGDSWSKRH